MPSNRTTSLARGAALLAVALTGVGGARAEAVPASGWLCCNLRVVDNRATDANALRAGERLVAPGTRVSALGVGESQLDLTIDGKPIPLVNEGSRSLSMDEFARRWVVAKDPTQEVTKWAPRIRRAIEKGRIVNGMNRKQVLMALGWPTTAATPDLQALTWTYHGGGGKTYKVVFNDARLVKAVEGDWATRTAVLLPSTDR
jgi:hypothetical protein